MSNESQSHLLIEMVFEPIIDLFLEYCNGEGALEEIKKQFGSAEPPTTQEEIAQYLGIVFKTFEKRIEMLSPRLYSEFLEQYVNLNFSIATKLALMKHPHANKAVLARLQEKYNKQAFQAMPDRLNEESGKILQDILADYQTTVEAVYES